MKLRHGRPSIKIRKEHEKRAVTIVADAGIAVDGIGGGRLIPLLILDTTDRPDLEELIRVHQHLTPGDVKFEWGKLKDSKGNVVLILSFERPIEIVAILEFDIVRQASLVDQILAVNCLYIQAGRKGDRFVKNLNAPKILVEVPETDFSEYWNEIFSRIVIKQMRKNGLNRQQAKQAAKQYIEEWRKFGQFRMT